MMRSCGFSSTFKAIPVLLCRARARRHCGEADDVGSGSDQLTTGGGRCGCNPFRSWLILRKHRHPPAFAPRRICAISVVVLRKLSAWQQFHAVWLVRGWVGWINFPSEAWLLRWDVTPIKYDWDGDPHRCQHSVTPSGGIGAGRHADHCHFERINFLTRSAGSTAPQNLDHDRRAGCILQWC
jgi:hypothetical protein